ncbi:DUF805 domain-containing protein [Protaetiibacter mangrovi]|uniref:DUF805 domain-containing protein n=1 Tax=Protaetiibacter mangrovi TaxID=2970926 RepID=A0ABT1ZG90_9MICO|nr:DUF805 domain-containing protein [Protaetiibacter mangrovi]MCS0499725.1 DUF805 domain-containing protein [Protaetiibacter mangrovi]TPX02391.1 DUF805 domain-containing protein [Schumannella luteola]
MTTSSAASLDLPLPGATFGQAVSRFFRKYATFSGRASLSEYWWWALATGIVYIGVAVVFLVGGAATGDLSTDGSMFTLGALASVGVGLLVIWFVVTLIPQLAVTVRRLHDANLSGWLVLLRLVPSVGDLIVLILTILPSNPAGVRFDRR